MKTLMFLSWMIQIQITIGTEVKTWVKGIFKITPDITK